MNTDLYMIYDILPANKTFTVTDGLISWLFVITFVHPTYMWIALIWAFLIWAFQCNLICENWSTGCGDTS